MVAVQLQLETAGFSDRKCGDDQHRTAGDRLLDNDGEVYTVDADSFARTCRQLHRGAYVKTTPVCAEASAADGSDGYAIGAEKFHVMYERAESPGGPDSASANQEY